MNTFEDTVTLFSISILALFFCGVIVFAVGKTLPGKGSWLIWAGLVILLTCMGLDAGVFMKQEIEIKSWKTGWIGDRESLGAITVGVLQDPLGLTMGVLATFVSIANLISQNSFLRQLRSEQIYAAIAISTAGVALSWISLTPWLGFVGLLATMLGGFIALGSHATSHADSTLAARFLWERSSGLLLALFGTCILASARHALFLNQPGTWAAPDGDLVSTWVGSCLLVSGVFFQIQPFPLLGWSVSDSEISLPIRTLLNQIFPIWAAFPILFRLEPHFRTLGLFPGIGWLVLIACVLTILCGLFQKHLRLGLGVWLNSGFCLSFAFLILSGPLSALALLIGTSLSGLCLAMVVSRDQDENGSEAKSETSDRNRVIVAQVLTFLGTAGGAGMFGFVSATGGIRWIVEGLSLPGELPLFFITFSLFVLLRWKLTWEAMRNKKLWNQSYFELLSLFLVVLFSLGFTWTGTLSGGIFPDRSDAFLPSLFALFFGKHSMEFAPSVDYIYASSVYWGALFLGVMTAYWTSGRRDDQWQKIKIAVPKTTRFIAGGYQVDRVMTQVGQGLSWLGNQMTTYLDHRLWRILVPTHLSRVGSQFSTMVTTVDSYIVAGLNELMRKGIEVPAKILQLIQSGDLRWYLVFALGSGFALLSHFLRPF